MREAEVALRKGRPVAQVYRTLGITEQTYSRWRNEYGSLKVLVRGNSRLKRVVAKFPLIS